MTDRLKGKTALVTGAGAEIGRAVTELFLEEGAHVIAADRSAEGLAGLADHPALTRLTLDVTDQNAVTDAARRHGDVNVLINCAGIVLGGTILDDGVVALQTSLALNVTATTMMIAAFLPAMVARKEGAIVNIASVAGTIMAVPSRFAYGTSKAAVIGLTKSVALDFIAQGIRCNAICPGTVDTPSLRQRLAATGDEAAARRAFVARQPMGRLGEANEIAALAVMLASDEARFLTGDAIVIDGGMSL